MAVCQLENFWLTRRYRGQAPSHILIFTWHMIELDAKGLYGRIELPTQHQQVLTLAAALTNPEQIILTQPMNPLTVIPNLTHRATLLRRDIGNAHRRVRNSLDSPDNLIQRTIGRLGLLGGGFGVLDLGAHAFY